MVDISEVVILELVVSSLTVVVGVVTVVTFVVISVVEYSKRMKMLLMVKLAEEKVVLLGREERQFRTTPCQRPCFPIYHQRNAAGDSCLISAKPDK